MADIAVQVADAPIAHARSSFLSLTALDIILTAARSPSGWVRLSSCNIVAPRRIQALGHGDLQREIHVLDNDVVVEKGDWISIPAGSTVLEARQWIFEMRKCERGKLFLKKGTVLGIVDQVGDVSGVVEIEDIIGEEEWNDFR